MVQTYQTKKWCKHITNILNKHVTYNVFIILHDSFAISSNFRTRPLARHCRPTQKGAVGQELGVLLAKIFCEWRFIVGKIMGKSAGKISWEKYGKIIGNL